MYSSQLSKIWALTLPTFAIWDSDDELAKYIDPDGFLDRDDELMIAIGFLAKLSGKLPSEILENPNWLKTLMFDLKVSNLTWREIYKLNGQSSKSQMQ